MKEDNSGEKKMERKKEKKEKGGQREEESIILAIRASMGVPTVTAETSLTGCFTSEKGRTALFLKEVIHKSCLDIPIWVLVGKVISSATSGHRSLCTLFATCWPASQQVWTLA